MADFSKFNEYCLVDGQRTKYCTTGLAYWEVGKEGSGWVLDLPIGTQFDISVPRFLEWAQSPHDEMVLPAALVHDVLLERGFDPAFASSEFRRVLRSGGASTFKQWHLYFATLLWTIAIRPLMNYFSKQDTKATSE